LSSWRSFSKKYRADLFLGMEAALMDMWAADGMANSYIVLSTLIPTTIPNGMLYHESINAQYRALVSSLAGEHCI
jgi:hypothetical protein